MPDADPPRLKVLDLHVVAPGGALLKGISLEVRAGEILSIIGPAGAGKSTFLKCLNRMIDMEPGLSARGEVFVDGWPIYRPDVDPVLVRKKIGVVYSVPVPLPMTVLENLTIGLRLSGQKAKGREELVERCLRAANLWDEVKDRLSESGRNLSGGQQQRLCLARSLMMEPDILLLDEPCSALDPISTLKIEEALQDLKKNLAIVLVTNNVKQAARASDRTAFFLFGEMIELSATEDLFTNPSDNRTREYVSGRFG